MPPPIEAPRTGTGLRRAALRAAAAVSAASRAAAWTAAAAFVAIGLIVSYEVVMRYAFLSPTRWVEELARILQIYGVFLACAWLVGERAHIRISLLTGVLPAAARVRAERFALAAVAAVSLCGAWYSAALMRFAAATGQYTDSTLALPLWALHAPVAAGLGLTAAQVCARLVEDFLEAP